MKDIHEIKEVVEISFIKSDFFFYSILIMIITIVSILVFDKIRKTKKRTIKTNEIKEETSIYEIYNKKINTLYKDWNKEPSFQVIEKLNITVKDFYKEKNNINIISKTTQETSNIIKSDDFIKFLTLSDIIKFSKSKPEIQTSIKEIFTLAKKIISPN